MVDTLAPKKIFTQRELDKKLMPIERQQTAIRPRASLAASTYNPVLDTNSALMENIVKPEVTTQPIKEIGQITAEQNQEVSSTNETQDIKQTGERVKEDSPQGLVMRPISYAAEGVKDKVVTNPILVGEEGTRPELIIPGKDGTITILDADITDGLMMPPTTPMQVPENDVVNGLMEKTKTPTPELSSTVSMKDTSTGFMTDEQREDVVYLSDNPNITGTVAQITGVGTLYTQALIKRKFDNEIVPTLKGKTLDLPKNIAGDDISGSLRDAYQHGYISGFTNLRDGTLQSEIMAQGREVPIYSLFRRLDQAEAKDNTMDMNNNKVGFAVANEVREELGYKGKTIPSNKIKEAEMLFNLKFNERYLDEIALYAAGKGKKYSDKVSKFDQYAQAFSREKPDRMILEFSPEYVKKEKEKLNK